MACFLPAVSPVPRRVTATQYTRRTKESLDGTCVLLGEWSPGITNSQGKVREAKLRTPVLRCWRTRKVRVATVEWKKGAVRMRL